MNNPRTFEPTVGDAFESLFKRFMAPQRVELEGGSLAMRMDVIEMDGTYKVRADIPGVKKDDIQVRIDGNIVQIDAAARKQGDIKGNGGKILCSERWKGPASRRFSVAQDVDETKALAKYEDGVLTLDLPKKATSAVKQISIR